MLHHEEREFDCRRKVIYIIFPFECFEQVLDNATSSRYRFSYQGEQNILKAANTFTWKCTVNRQKLIRISFSSCVNLEFSYIEYKKFRLNSLIAIQRTMYGSGINRIDKRIVSIWLIQSNSTFSTHPYPLQANKLKITVFYYILTRVGWTGTFGEIFFETWPDNPFVFKSSTF